jgi:sarcosine oxidase
MRYDVAVVGLGGMGSAILAHCAARGASVIGLEQFGPAHELGSSSGKSRMIRKAYFEDPAYVPLLLRAYELWRELERESGEELLQITGLLMAGEESSQIINGARCAAREHGLSIESLSQRQIQARYPTLQVRDGEVGVFEPDGGVLVPERAVRAYLSKAAMAGAQVRFGVAMEDWDATTEGFEIRLLDSSRVSARVLVLTLGPWLKETLESLAIPVRVQRNIQVWFTPATDAYEASRFPPFLLDRQGLPAPLYGFPDFGDGVKAAFHSHGELTDADKIDRQVNVARDIEPVARAMDQWMPGAATTLRAAKPCPYTLTPDGHFVVDRHPEHSNLILCGGFSGHGFKFAPVIGEIGADLALEGGSRHRIDFLSHRRFSRASGASN